MLNWHYFLTLQKKMKLLIEEIPPSALPGHLEAIRPMLPEAVMPTVVSINRTVLLPNKTQFHLQVKRELFFGQYPNFHFNELAHISAPPPCAARVGVIRLGPGEA